MGQSRKLSQKKRILILMSISSTLFFGCGPGGQGQSSSSLGDSSFEQLPTSNIDPMPQVQKVYYDEATLEQLVPHKAACPGNSSNPHHQKVCISICHVPPGNPANEQSKVLPLEAMKAHMGHGDYLGECQADVPVVNPTPTPTATPAPGDSTSPSDGSTPTETPAPTPTPGDSTSPSDGSTPTETPTPTPTPTDPTDPSQTETPPADGQTGSQTPQWCVPFLPVDADCDGINDATGESYF